ncbi:MAG: hypothetical protein M3Y08_14510 [Fibrobacterota bacterium]|nr:hypothetical protein [Fibrobacterota bacterium]
MAKTIFGVFLLLPAVLIGMNQLFEHWQFGPYVDLLIKVVLLVITFSLIGFVFLKPVPTGSDQDDIPAAP